MRKEYNLLPYADRVSSVIGGTWSSIPYLHHQRSSTLSHNECSPVLVYVVRVTCAIYPVLREPFRPLNEHNSLLQPIFLLSTRIVVRSPKVLVGKRISSFLTLYKSFFKCSSLCSTENFNASPSSWGPLWSSGSSSYYIGKIRCKEHLRIFTSSIHSSHFSLQE